MLARLKAVDLGGDGSLGTRMGLSEVDHAGDGSRLAQDSNSVNHSECKRANVEK